MTSNIENISFRGRNSFVRYHVLVSHRTSILCKVIEGKKDRGVHKTNLVVYYVFRRIG